MISTARGWPRAGGASPGTESRGDRTVHRSRSSECAVTGSPLRSPRRVRSSPGRHCRCPMSRTRFHSTYTGKGSNPHPLIPPARARRCPRFIPGSPSLQPRRVRFKTGPTRIPRRVSCNARCASPPATRSSPTPFASSWRKAPPSSKRSTRRSSVVRSISRFRRGVRRAHPSTTTSGSRSRSPAPTSWPIASGSPIFAPRSRTPSAPPAASCRTSTGASATRCSTAPPPRDVTALVIEL